MIKTNSMMEHTNNCPVVLYTAPDGTTQLDVKLENETVWLTQSQMAMLFDVDRTSVLRHIRNIYKSEELAEISTCAKNAQVRTEGERQIVREISYYNLDMIISVGYRVNSKRATSFRRWATTILKQYLIKGYAIDQRRLDHYNELKDVVKLMSRAISLQDKVTEGEFGGLFNVIGDYVYALDTLDRYDYQELVVDKTTTKEPFHATYDNAMEAIRDEDLPSARQALAEGAELCDKMREGMNHLLRTQDFTELEAALRAADGHLELNAPEEAFGELRRAQVQVETLEWLSRRLM